MTLDPPPERGEWLKLDLSVTGKDTGLSATLTVWVAQLPGDINQDGVVNTKDATALGNEWRGKRRPQLLDINGDGEVNIQDVTAFGG